MKRIKIMMVCGFGLGSSLVLKMTVDKVLKNHGISAETFCSDEATARGEFFDMVFTSEEMSHLFQGSPKPVIVIKNFLSPDEVEEKGLAIIQSLVQGG
jgi:PTS system ascorbate-specific IIB component